MTAKTSVAFAAAGLLALTACVDPSVGPGPSGAPGDPNRTRTGALIGAGVGALAGANRGADNQGDRLRNAAIGAGIGAAVGGVAGNILDKQAQELRGDFSNGAIDVINTGNELIVRMPQDILFAIDSASVGGGLQGDLRVLAANLNRYPNSTVEVQGHTDNTGSAAYNADLSQRRAQSVASILAQNGVSSGRLRAVGFGEDSPIASNLSPEGRAQNRRVQIVIRPTN